MNNQNWRCPKCQHDEFEASEMRASGGFWSSFFDLQNKRFAAVTCRRCKFTEFYKSKVSNLHKVFDFLNQ